MNIINQCCTLEQSKNLKLLGVKQVAAFSWYIATDRDDTPGFNRASENGCAICGHPVAPYIEEVSAFTVAELCQMLPDYYPSWRFEVHTGGPKKWVATVICSPKPPGIDDIHTASEFDSWGDTQAESLATLLIALLETEVITPDEVNKRL